MTTYLQRIADRAAGLDRPESVNPAVGNRKTVPVEDPFEAMDESGSTPPADFSPRQAEPPPKSPQKAQGMEGTDVQRSQPPVMHRGQAESTRAEPMVPPADPSQPLNPSLDRGWKRGRNPISVQSEKPLPDYRRMKPGPDFPGEVQRPDDGLNSKSAKTEDRNPPMSSKPFSASKHSPEQRGKPQPLPTRPPSAHFPEPGRHEYGRTAFRPTPAEVRSDTPYRPLTPPPAADSPPAGIPFSDIERAVEQAVDKKTRSLLRSFQAQPSEPARLAPHRPPPPPSPRPKEPQPQTIDRTERVEVVRPPEEPARPLSRPGRSATSGGSSHRRSSKLRFGLGQM